jgi:hypothetical protein
MALKERVLTIHGIETSGAWQEELARVFACHFDCIPIKYSQYRWFGPLELILEPYVLAGLGVILLAMHVWRVPSTVWWAAFWSSLFLAYLATYVRRRLAFNKMLQQASDYAQPAYQSKTHLIAHSLGTYLIGRALRTRAYFHVGRIVFVGCVLPRNFPWSKLIGLGGAKGHQFLEVRNELGRKDIVVLMAWMMSWLIRGLGIAGFSGFKGPPELIHTTDAASGSCGDCPTGGLAPIHNVVSGDLGHSDTFVGSGYAEVFWLPFMWGIDPNEYKDFLELCNLAAGLEREWSSSARAGGHVDPRLVNIETLLLARSWKWSGGKFGDFLAQEVVSRYPLTGQPLQQSVGLAVRGVWQSVMQALEARQTRENRFRQGLPTDPVVDTAVRCLDPREAVRRAVALLP